MLFALPSLTQEAIVALAPESQSVERNFLINRRPFVKPIKIIKNNSDLSSKMVKKFEDDIRMK